MASLQRMATELRGQPASAGETRLDVTAQILNFEPGLYSVEVLAPKTMCGASGMLVPCVRLDPIVQDDGPRAFVSTLTDRFLVDPDSPPAYLRVAGGKASVLLTIYKLANGMPAPELRITLVQQAVARISEAKPAEIMASGPLRLMTHIERSGDMTVSGGTWAGQAGGRGTLEGFSVTPSGGVRPEDIEYQAILGQDWTTPWLAGGEFCGSRGLSLPLLGVRIRLRGEAAKTHQCLYWGRFAGAGELGPVADGAVCASGGAVMESLRVVLSRRAELGLADGVASRATAPPASPPPADATQKAKLRVAADKDAPPPTAKAPPKPTRQTAARSLSSIRATLGRK